MTFPFHPRRHGQTLLLCSLGLAWASAILAEPVPTRAVAAVEIAAAPALSATTGAPQPQAAQPAPLPTPQIDIGSATQALWELQRASVGTYPRSIDGEQASRSYQRYLKSFETQIPEQYNAGLGLQK